MNPEQILNRFSTHLKNVVSNAMALAASLKHSEVLPMHLLTTIYEEQGSVAIEILNKMGIKKDILYKILYSTPKGETVSNAAVSTLTALLPGLSKTSKQALEKSMLTAYERSHNYVGTEHLLWGLINLKDPIIEMALKECHVVKQQMEDEIENALATTSRFPDIEDVSNLMDQIQDMVEEGRPPLPSQPIIPLRIKKQKPSALDVFATDLTDKNLQKNIDPVIGREKEISRIINILSRRTKNNPVLVGETGVGKTAIVEGLAKKITEGEVPEVLCGKKIISLDMTLLLAGTIYRGEFEARLKQIIDEIAREPNVILFIDEMHNIIGAGSSQGAMDAANILKPALARGQLRCIGTTTIDEYKKYISNDPALERRLQSVFIDEPSKEETLKILRGIKKYYEQFHNTAISEEAMASAVDLSVKYIHNNFLPDKAIDLIDEACAAARVQQKPSVLGLKQQKLRNELEECRNKKMEAIRAEQYESAMEWKKKEEMLVIKMKNLEKQTAKSEKPTKKKITAKHIAKILEMQLHLPAEIILANEWEELEKLPERLKKYIIGQDKAIDTLVKTLHRAYLGLKNKNQPLASFLFIGPTGVGKTELAKVLARELYHNEKALIKLDMSEFAEPHSISKILGSPAGYVGYKDRNRFTDEIRQHPYSVILFDEIDKAHPDVNKLLMQILDEGELTESAGKKIHFQHTIIALTTNLGSELFKSASIGFGRQSAVLNEERDKNVISKLKEQLGVPLISRLDSICIFSPLTEENLKQIINLQIESLNEELKKNNQIHLKLNDTALKEMAKQVYNPELGARNVERTIHDVVHELIADLMRKKNRKTNYTVTKQGNGYRLI